MSTSRTRIARFAASAALVLGLGALGAGPANAAWWLASSDTAITIASEDGVTLGEDQLDKARSAEDAIIILAAEDDAAPDGNGYWLV